MKKICYVTTVHNTLQSFVVQSAMHLHAYGDYDITFVCNPDSAFAASLPESIHFHPIPMKRGISLGGIGAMFKMVKFFREEKFDLVQYSTPNASLYASLAAWLAGVPVRLYCQWGIAYVGMQGAKRKIFKTVEKLVCKLSTRIEPDSFGNLHFSHAEKLYTPEKSAVVWNGSASGVDTARFDIANKDTWRKEIREKYNIPANAFVFGFMGRITRDKGLNELLQAYQNFTAVTPNTYLLLGGRTENPELLSTELMDWAQNAENVIFCGQVSDPERHYAAMDVYILPSYREGFGSVVIEAEAMGVPVIVTDIPGPTDAMLPGKTGLIVKKADVETLQSAMQTLFDDSALRDRFAEAGLAFAKDNFEQKILFTHILEDRRNLIEKR